MMAMVMKIIALVIIPLIVMAMTGTVYILARSLIFKIFA